MKENFSIRELSHPNFGVIRTATGTSDEPLFSAVDIARALGYSITSGGGILGLVRPCDKQQLESGPCAGFYINRTGLNSVQRKTRKPYADELVRWLKRETNQASCKTFVQNTAVDDTPAMKKSDVSDLAGCIETLHDIQDTFLKAFPDPDDKSRSLIDRFTSHVSDMACTIGDALGYKAVTDIFGYRKPEPAPLHPDFIREDMPF